MAANGAAMGPLGRGGVVRFLEFQQRSEQTIGASAPARPPVMEIAGSMGSEQQCTLRAAKPFTQAVPVSEPPSLDGALERNSTNGSAVASSSLGAPFAQALPLSEPPRLDSAVGRNPTPCSVVASSSLRLGAPFAQALPLSEPPCLDSAVGRNSIPGSALASSSLGAPFAQALPFSKPPSLDSAVGRNPTPGSAVASSSLGGAVEQEATPSGVVASAAGGQQSVALSTAPTASPPVQASPPFLPRSLEGRALPRVAVFDLDETCWNHYGLDAKKAGFKPPFSWCTSLHTVVDGNGKVVQMFPELPAVLLELHQAGVLLAVASHDTKPAWCLEVIDNYLLDEDTALTWGSLVPDQLRIIRCSGEYWPGKGAHLRDIIQNLPGGPCEFKDMLLFDDNKSVCKQANGLGAVAIRCVGGVSMARLEEGLSWWEPCQGQKRKLMN